MYTNFCRIFRLFTLLWFFCCLSTGTTAQTKQEFVISGKVLDGKSKEVLPGATIQVKGTMNGVVTDSYGSFRFGIKEGNYTFVISYLGYFKGDFDLTISSDSNLNFELQPNTQSLEEVTVSYRSDNAIERVNRSEVSVERIDVNEAKLLPVIFGEVDIIKVLQLKPGVKSGPEGTAGFYVRGGSNDQNLILLDKAPVYNPNHLFGFFSVFGPEAIEDVTLYKAGFPSKYGGRLSSVLDVRVREANTDSLSVQGGIGLIASRLNVNVPIVKDKLSLMLSGRRTYADLISEGINRINRNRPAFNPIPRYYFYDFNGNIQYQIDDKSKLSLSSYFGNDFFNFQNQNFGTLFTWGNRSSTLKLQTRHRPNLQSEHALFYSAYRYRINSRLAGSNLTLGSDINDIGLQSDWNYFSANGRLRFNWGGSFIHHEFSIGDFGIDTGVTALQQGTRRSGQEIGVYFTSDYDFSNRLSLQLGIRNSGFFSGGIYYNGLEPRMMINQKVSEKSSLKASFARMYQYLHLVTTSTAALPTDIWHPSTPNIRPQSSDQLALGIHNSILGGKYFFSIEGYYKWIRNAIDFRDGAQLFGNPNLENEFVFGKGWAYGTEVYLEKKTGRTRGWIGYTLSWSYRQFDEINNGNAFFPRFDQRHNVSLVVIHQLNKRWSLSGTWIYGTGNFASIASGRLAFQDILPSQIDAIPDYSGRNDFQMPATHRLDLGAVYKLNSKRGEADLTIGVYNAYSRRNPFFVRYQEIENEQEEVTGFSPSVVSLFPIIPSITYNFKF